ncbi:hypothetical protein M758_7G129400 [Ceratodon purpureus]|nr:hypothetical protein M758_7G129400 [Ceratodon purpureus]
MDYSLTDNGKPVSAGLIFSEGVIDISFYYKRLSPSSLIMFAHIFFTTQGMNSDHNSLE